ncbi:MAG: hypothetical protein DBY37_12160 [Desulfovibrionaceae bacterium]|nr:MAG: hypothetical protein DBY37_12160 [Desulfovibrionaceae bacterium]
MHVAFARVENTGCLCCNACCRLAAGAEPYASRNATNTLLQQSLTPHAPSFTGRIRQKAPPDLPSCQEYFSPDGERFQP